MSQLHAGQDTKPQEGDSTSRGPRPGARLGSLSSCQRGVPRRASCGLVALAGTSLHAGLGPEDNLAGCREAARAGGAESGSRGVGKGWKEWESERKAGRLRAPLCNPGRRYLWVGKSASSASGNFLWSHKQYLTLRIFPR